MFVLEDAYAYGISICKARRFTEEEKQSYVPEFREFGFVGIGQSEVLEYISWKDMPSRTPDGSFIGCGNRAWIVTDEEADAYRSLNAARKQEEAEKRAAEEALLRKKIAQRAAEEAATRAQFDRWDMVPIEKYVVKHTFDIHGETLSFLERDIFDVGRVVNPDYAIAPGIVGGLSSSNDNNVLMWMDYVDGSGWNEVRPLTENEKKCINAIYKYGKYAKSQVRMYER